MDVIQEPEPLQAQMTIWEHLEELRRRLIICIITVLVGFVICWFYREQLFYVVERPFLQYVQKGEKLTFITLTEPFFVYMKVAAFASLIFTSPILISQLWLFIAPG